MIIGGRFSILTAPMKQYRPKNPLITAGILTALCVAIGYLFLLIPNVELMTAAVFLAGTVTGVGSGAMIGAVAETLYSLFNPYGAPVPSLLVAQVGVFALIGCCGGLWRKRPTRVTVREAILTGAVGLSLTLLYDLLTTLSFSLPMTGYSLKKSAAFFVTGAPFYLIHLGGNLLVFSLAVPQARAALDSFLREHCAEENCSPSSSAAELLQSGRERK